MTQIELPERVTWASFYREAMQRHHDYYTGMFQNGKAISPLDLPDIALARSREVAGLVQPLCGCPQTRE